MEKNVIIPLQNDDDLSEQNNEYSAGDNDANFDPFKNVLPQKQNVFKFLKPIQNDIKLKIPPQKPANATLAGLRS